MVMFESEQCLQNVVKIGKVQVARKGHHPLDLRPLQFQFQLNCHLLAFLFLTRKSISYSQRPEA